MKDLHHSCQGESHIHANKVCQDRSFSETDEAMSIAIVCDGHGGARYFRSDVGAQCAVDATKECVRKFIKEVNPALLKGKPFTQREALTTQRQALTTEANDKNLRKETSTDEAFKQLFASIIYKWRELIFNSSLKNPHSAKQPFAVSTRDL